jgi:hypothetical protein
MREGDGVTSSILILDGTLANCLHDFRKLEKNGNGAKK